MEADSTTFEKNTKSEVWLPFSINPSNYDLYREFIDDRGKGNVEQHIIEVLQSIGLLHNVPHVKCSSAKPGCRVVCKTARVVDRVQFFCEECGARQPIRTGSFFSKLLCSILQALQVILAWCEDADCAVATEHFGVKPRVATVIYSRLDELAANDQLKCRLGGEGSVVLVELYPDCLNRLSPDTTDQPHAHKILMLADTKHIPTRYYLHVVKDFNKKISNSTNLYSRAMKAEVEQVISRVTEPNSVVVTGNNLPLVDGASSLQQLVQHCDADMQHFLSSRIWRQAVTLCSASRDICAEGTTTTCGVSVQRYLNTSLYRIRHGDGFYRHMLDRIAAEHTQRPASPTSAV